MAHLQISGERFEIEAFDAGSPNTLAKLREAGASAGPVHFDGWSGPCGTVEVTNPALSAIDFLEQPVASIYPGVIALRPSGAIHAAYDTPLSGRVPKGKQETCAILVSFGYAESRHAHGKQYVTPIARLASADQATLRRLENALLTDASEGHGVVIDWES